MQIPDPDLLAKESYELEALTQEVLTAIEEAAITGKANGKTGNAVWQVLLMAAYRTMRNKHVTFTKKLMALCAKRIAEKERDAIERITIRLMFRNGFQAAIEMMGAYSSFESFFEDFVKAHSEKLGKRFSENLDPEGQILRKHLLDAWNAKCERKEAARKARALAEEIQYRRLERTERHRLKRLAEEEAARRLAEEQAQKQKTEEARRERERRKAEARARAEQAKEEARLRLEKKRAEWLVAHPRKRNPV